MPELPEVETIVRYLRPKVRGKRILGVWSNTPRLFRKHGSAKQVESQVKGKRIKNVKRVGKNVVLVLGGEYDLYIHLMMTGKLLLGDYGLEEPHMRFCLKLSGGQRLCLHDIRKFARIRLLSKGKDAVFSLGVGKDAFLFSLEELESLIKCRQGRIKNLLMNQKIISGIGNIYSDEILWRSGIKPTRKASTLSKQEIHRLFRAIKQVLSQAIHKQGTSMRDYRKPDNQEGGYYKIRKVYNREGRKCSRDGAVIKRMVISQRSAYYCPRHQG